MIPKITSGTRMQPITTAQLRTAATGKAGWRLLVAVEGLLPADFCIAEVGEMASENG
jgi:hypothetical protein